MGMCIRIAYSDERVAYREILRIRGTSPTFLDSSFFNSKFLCDFLIRTA